MHKGFDGLAAVVQTQLSEDPFSGQLFVFRGRAGDRVKILWWSDEELCLFAKRLERGRFNRTCYCFTGPHCCSPPCTGHHIPAENRACPDTWRGHKRGPTRHKQFAVRINHLEAPNAATAVRETSEQGSPDRARRAEPHTGPVAPRSADPRYPPSPGTGSTPRRPAPAAALDPEPRP
ncbi:MAG: IS66 family insertion sequence element accessory protein TnpB [Terriglobia bacterium]